MFTGGANVQREGLVFTRGLMFTDRANVHREDLMYTGG